MNDVEKKILEASNVQKIHKSSDDILNAYQIKHKHRVQKKFIFIPALTTLASVAAATAVIFILKPVSVHLEGQTKGFDDGSTVLTSLVSDLSIHHYVQPSFGSNSSVHRKAVTQEEFVQAVTDIDGSYSSYSYYQSHKKGFNYAFDSTRFNYDDVMYKYQLCVNNTTVFLKDNISEINTKGTFNGLIRIDDNYYPCEIDSKVNNNHVRTEFKYRIGTSFYTLNHETLNQKTRIRYTVAMDEILSLVESVELKYNSNIFSAIFVSEDPLLEIDRERAFSHKDSDNFISVDYVKNTLSTNVHYENIHLTVSSQRAPNRTYTYEDLDPIVI